MDKHWLSQSAEILQNIKNSESIFNIGKEITVSKNDQRVLEMLAEFDGARWLFQGSINGKYDHIEYLPKSLPGKSPDFLAIRCDKKFAVEVKMLSPQNINEQKFISRIITKANKDAIPQLESFFDDNPFDAGLIFIWTHTQIKLEKIKYRDIDKIMKQKIQKPSFPLSIYMTVYAHGIWDFHF